MALPENRTLTPVLPSWARLVPPPSKPTLRGRFSRLKERAAKVFQRGTEAVVIQPQIDTPAVSLGTPVAENHTLTPALPEWARFVPPPARSDIRAEIKALAVKIWDKATELLTPATAPVVTPPAEIFAAPPAEVVPLPVVEVLEPEPASEPAPIAFGFGISRDLAEEAVRYLLQCDVEARTAAGVNVTNPPDYVYFTLFNQLASTLAPLALDVTGAGVQVFGGFTTLETRPFEVALVNMKSHLERRAEIQGVEFHVDMDYLSSLYPEAVELFEFQEAQPEPAVTVPEVVTGARARSSRPIGRTLVAGVALTGFVITGAGVADHYLEPQDGATDHQNVRTVPVPEFAAPANAVANIAAPQTPQVVAPVVDDCAHVPPASADLQKFAHGDYVAYAQVHLDKAMRAVCAGTPSDITEAKKQAWGYQWAAWELGEQQGLDADKVVSAVYDLGRDKVAPSEVTRMMSDANRSLAPGAAPEQVRSLR